MNSYNSLQLWYNGKGQSRLKNLTLHTKNMEPDELIVRSLYSYISAGTERTIICNPPKNKVISKEMAVPYMLGNFNSEFTYGYSLVGEVIEGTDKWLGKTIHVMHPHQEYAMVKERDVYCIPDGISSKAATLISNLETVINAVWDSELTLGDKVLIVGFGNIGALLASVVKRIPGVDVYISETNQTRKEFAIKQNFNVLSLSELKDNFTISFNTSNSESGLQLAIDQTSIEGKVVELSWYGPRNISLELGGSFHYGRKQLISSQVSRIPAKKRLYFDYKSRKDLVIKLLSEIDFNFMLNIEVPFQNAPEIYNQLINDKINEIGLLFNYKL